MANYIQTIALEDQYDVVIVGAGISGLTLAERYASIGKRLLIIEKRHHIGGNCHDFINEAGILVSKYGPHYFHTNDEKVWQYVNRFSQWHPYEHRVVGHNIGKTFPIPVNRITINTAFDLNLKNEKEVEEWINTHKIPIAEPQNAEEAVLARMGKELYELIFKGYTTKQWGMDPRDLGAEVTNRIPFRTNDDDRYFTDTYQGVPLHGYTKLCEALVDNPLITIMLSADWDQCKNQLSSIKKLFFTGKIDQYFSEKYGSLEYRSLRFEFETLDQEWYQQYAQENYPSLEVPYTRIVEYKRSTGQTHPKTTISREYSTSEGEPYYPIPSERNRIIYEKYQQAATELEKQNIFFVGRLANYKYFNMDQAFKNALDLFDRIENGVK
ncbi:MAG: UDP-galactopyranose mutase [Candidatus Nomurabacteria bacterium]|nr:UDP-galactopyranose mutase [Candidatus Nomurabacteria bacterium]